MLKRVGMVMVALAFALPLLAGRRRAVQPVDPDLLTLEFVDVAGDGSLAAAGSNAWLNVGNVTKRDTRVRGSHVRRDFGLRVVRGNGLSFGTARLSVRLQTWDGRATVRLDGRVLTTNAVVIDPGVSIGQVVVHHLEIDIADSTPAGQIDASLLWEATTE